MPSSQHCLSQFLCISRWLSLPSSKLLVKATCQETSSRLSCIFVFASWGALAFGHTKIATLFMVMSFRDMQFCECSEKNIFLGCITQEQTRWNPLLLFSARILLRLESTDSVHLVNSSPNYPLFSKRPVSCFPPKNICPILIGTFDNFTNRKGVRSAYQPIALRVCSWYRTALIQAKCITANEAHSLYLRRRAYPSVPTANFWRATRKQKLWRWRKWRWYDSEKGRWIITLTLCIEKWVK